MVPDPVPFQRFFAEHAPAVGRFLTGLVGPAEAEECLQESFLAALLAYEDFDGEHPRAWILTIARRKAIDAVRASERRPGPTSDPDSVAAVAVPAGGIGGEIWDEVARLPEKQRAALILRYALDLRHREIGRVLDCSEAAARRSVHEGIAKLRSSRVAEVA